tara:strand:+ start:7845 stop:8300 length:456 start_codon:yes stop_codon:yes gene_type:complete
MILDKTKILEYQQNRDPYLMIDYVEDVVPAKYANGYKILNANEWFFKVHWAGDPNMPAMLQTEAMVQMAAMSLLTIPEYKGKVVYLTSASKLEFKKKILPNSKLNLETKILNFKRGIANCSAKGIVDDKVACFGEFTIVLPDVINKFKIGK